MYTAWSLVMVRVPVASARRLRFDKPEAVRHSTIARIERNFRKESLAISCLKYKVLSFAIERSIEFRSTVECHVDGKGDSPLLGQEVDRRTPS